MTIYQILDWHWINLAAPFIGLVSCARILISHKTCTKRIAVSSAVALSIMFWLMLTWADWGSIEFIPSYQTMWARVLLLIIATLVAYELRNYTRIMNVMRNKNRRLLREKRQLQTAINKLESQLNQQKDLLL